MFEKLFVLLLLIFPEQKQEDRRHALEKMGISVQSSGIKVSIQEQGKSGQNHTIFVQVEKNKYFLVNLNADPSLNELLVYYLKDKTLVLCTFLGRLTLCICVFFQIQGVRYGSGTFSVASFLVPNTFPIIFIVEKCVHFDTWST